MDEKPDEPAWEPGEDAEIVARPKGPVPLQAPPPPAPIAPLDPVLVSDADAEDAEEAEAYLERTRQERSVERDSSPDLPAPPPEGNGRSRGDERAYTVERKLDRVDLDLIRTGLLMLEHQRDLAADQKARLLRLHNATLLELVGGVEARNSEQAARRAAKELLRVEGHHDFIVVPDRYRISESGNVEADWKWGSE